MVFGEAARWGGLALAALTFSCGDESHVVGIPRPVADVVAVEVEGEPGAYTFRVTVYSADEGCHRYADWWEVIGEEGELLHRRVLTHSHVDEQPFERSGGPVDIPADRIVWVRAHMHPSGYGGAAWRGSPQGGFMSDVLPADFAPEAAEVEPLPTGCRF